MSQLITVTTFSKLAVVDQPVTTAIPMVINVARIVSITTRAVAFQTTGVTNVVYALPVNNTTYQITLVCTETRAALLALANSNAIAT